MDKDILTQLLLNLNAFQNSIEKVQQYCCQNERQSEEIVELFMKEFRVARKDKKIFFFYACHEIIIESSKRNKDFFVKSFGLRLKEIVKIICETQDQFEVLKKVLQVIDRWKEDQIYHKDFCQKLNNFIAPYYSDLKKQYEKYYGEKDQKGKYTKTFIVNYLIVNEDNTSSRVFSSISNTTQAIQKLDKMNVLIDSFLKKNAGQIPAPLDQKTQEKLYEMIVQAKDEKEALIKEIEESQEVYKQLCDKSIQEIENYENFTYQALDTWQQKFKELID